MGRVSNHYSQDSSTTYEDLMNELDDINVKPDHDFTSKVEILQRNKPSKVISSPFITSTKQLSEFEATLTKPKRRKNGLQNSRYASRDGEDYNFDANSISNEPSFRKLKEILKNPPPNIPNFRIYIVIDTNFFISHLDIINNLLMLATAYHYTIIVPDAVTKELDGIKTCGNPTLERQAQKANGWLFEHLANNSRYLRGQRKNEKLDSSSRKDDGILDCCLYFHEKYDKKGLVILLSNDVNLCVKALKESILTVTYKKGIINSTFVADAIYQEACLRASGKSHHVDEYSNGSSSDETSNGSYHQSSSSNLPSITTSNDSISSQNIYLQYSNSEFYSKIYNDLQKASLSFFLLFLKQVQFPHPLEDPESLVDLLKIFRTNYKYYKLDQLWIPNLASPHLSSLELPNFFKKSNNQGILINNKGKFCVYENISSPTFVWTIGKMQEKLIINKPTSYFHTRKLVHFWSIILCKFVLVVDKTGRSIQSLEKLFNLWDKTIEINIDKDTIAV